MKPEESRAESTETDDRWRIILQGMQIIRIKVRYQLALLVDGDAEVTIETEALLTRVGEVAQTRHPYGCSPSGKTSRRHWPRSALRSSHPSL